MTVGVQLADKCLVTALVSWLVVGEVLVNVVAHDSNEHRAVAIFSTQGITDLVAHLIHPSLGERHITEVLAHIDLDGIVFDGHGANFQVTHAHVIG